MRRETRLAFHVVLSVLASLALAPSALAGTRVVASGDKLAITGDDGPNDVRIDYADGSNTWDVTIGGGIDSWDGCDYVSATSLSCPYASVIDAIGTSDTGTEGMGAGNDSFRVGYGSDDVPAGFPDLPRPVRVDLGRGDDFFGGSEAGDIALGQEGDDVLDGAAGHDWLGGGEVLPLNHPNSLSQGFDQVFGGPGGDVVYDGDLTSNRGPDLLDGGGCNQAAHPSCPAIPLGESLGDWDFVYYYFRNGSITLNLANEGASQGESGEADTVRKFEQAWTGEGADTVTGNAAVNRILTEGGNDTINVSGDPGNVDLVYCGAGLDKVIADDGDYVDYTTAYPSCDLPAPPQPPVAPPPTPPAPFLPQPPSSLPRPVPAPRPVRGGTSDALVAAVAQQLAQAGRTLRRCGTTGLLRKNGCRDLFTALRPGTVVYRVTAAGTGTRAGAGTLIASGRKAIRAAGSYPVKVKATKKGRRQLRKALKLRAMLTVTFTDSSGNIAKRSKTVVLRRRDR
jgi:hypothetical protein